VETQWVYAILTQIIIRGKIRLRFFILLFLSVLIISCALSYELGGADRYMININKFLGERYCYQVKNSTITVVSEGRGDKFIFKPSAFLETPQKISCANKESLDVNILSAYLNLWADTGRHKRKVFVKVKVGLDVYSGVGESEWVNAVVDFSGTESEDSRREAIYRALKDALQKASADKKLI